MKSLGLVALAGGWHGHWHGRLSLRYNVNTTTTTHGERALPSMRRPATMKPLELQAPGTPLRAAWREVLNPVLQPAMRL